VAKEREGDAKPEKREAHGARVAEDHAVICAACNHALTKRSARIEIDGAHEHAFANPAGLTFRVACLREAPGSRADGDESTFWTWFSGYAWRVALCGACGEHVGWSYANDASGFFGLITTRIKTA
jgi:hypothetical protein